MTVRAMSVQAMTVQAMTLEEVVGVNARAIRNAETEAVRRSGLLESLAALLDGTPRIGEAQRQPSHQPPCEQAPLAPARRAA